MAASVDGKPVKASVGKKAQPNRLLHGLIELLNSKKLGCKAEPNPSGFARE
jgi:hypothetical protein